MTLAVTGRVVALAKSNPRAVERRRIWIADDGTIDSITTTRAPAPAGFAKAKRVDVGEALVLPGLIDLHNHLGYNTLPLWTEKTQVGPFRHHNDWTDAPGYKANVTWPAWVMAKADPGALLAYVQARALMGGATATQGWPTGNRKTGLALRNVDDEDAGAGTQELIYTSVVTKSPLELAKMAQRIDRGTGFIYHCAEGARGSVVRNEFVDASSAGCLRKTFIGIHCNALKPSDWKLWSKKQAGGVVWSPFSNLWLYGETLDVPAALERGVSICLGSDWGPSGTKNILGELKVARVASDTLGFGLRDEQLVGMVTTNPGDLLAGCWDRPVGRIVPAPSPTSWSCAAVRGRSGRVVEATEADVLLTIVNGRPRCGEPTLMQAAGAGAASSLTVGGLHRKLAIPDPEQPDTNLSWRQIHARLQDVLDHPKRAVDKAEKRRRGWAGPIDDHRAPLELALDMPGGGGLAYAGPPPDLGAVTMPALPSLVHDDAFFRAVDHHPIHNGVLKGLERFYP